MLKLTTKVFKGKWPQMLHAWLTIDTTELEQKGADGLWQSGGRRVPSAIQTVFQLKKIWGKCTCHLTSNFFELVRGLIPTTPYCDVNEMGQTFY